MASLNSRPTKTKSRFGAINSPKLWAKVAFFTGIIVLVAIIVRGFLSPPDIAVWKLQTDSVIGQLENPLNLQWVTVQNHTLFFNTQAGETVALDQRTGKILWLRQTDADSPFPPFVINDTTIGVLTLASEVFAFDSTTGKTQWIFEPEQMTQPDTPPLVDGEMIYFADRSGLLYALNKKTGQLNWQIQFKTLPTERFQSAVAPLIHFGLMSQSENLLIINHAPEQSLITIDKKTAQRVKTVSQQKFNYKTPVLAQDGTPTLAFTTAATPNKNHFYIAGNSFALCDRQTALCKNSETAQRSHNISLSALTRSQQRQSFLKLLLPKLAQPLAITSEPKTAATDQPIDWEFDFTDTTVNNLWSEINTELILVEKKQRQKISVIAYPLNQHRWRATVKIPTAGEWHWKLKVTSPTEKRTAKGKLSVTQTVEPRSYSWPGLGFQDALLDLNSNDDYFDQVFVGATQQPPKDFTTAKITDFEKYLQNYADPATGFTAFRWSVDNFNFPLLREISEENFQLSLKGGQNGDKLVRSVANKNLSLDLDMFGFKPPFLTEAKLNYSQQRQLKRYLKFMVARYGAFVTSWEIGNEVTPSDAWITTVAQLLKRVDPYHHPVSINWERDQKLGLDFTSLHHYFSVKPSAAQGEFLSMIEPYKNTQQTIIFTELGNADASWDTDSAKRFRIRLWTAFMSQTPVFFWAHNGPIFLNPGNNANVYLGPLEMAAVAAFRKLTLSKSTEWISLPADSDNKQLSALALQNKDTLWIYVTNTQENGLAKGIITVKDRQPSSVTWYDPASGKQIGTTTDFGTPSFLHDIIGITKKEP